MQSFEKRNAMDRSTTFFMIGLFGAILLPACSNSQHPPGPGFISKIIRVGKGVGSVEVADLNRDSFPDIVAANVQDSSVTVLLNDGKGNFTPPTGSPFFTNRNPNDIAIADFNRDGNPD